MAYWIIHFFFGAMLACETPEKEQEPEQPTDLSCIEMTRSQCMQSAVCTLELTEENSIYNCREAVGVCEEGVVQNDIMGNTEGNTNCQTLEECEILPGECYCPCPGYGQTAVEDDPSDEDCSCMCGGEEPPSCVSTEAE